MQAFLSADNSVFYTPTMRAGLAIRTIVRAWTQYRTDRGISAGAHILDIDGNAQRNAFLSLLSSAIQHTNSPLREAIKTVRSAAVPPIASEAEEAHEIIAASQATLTDVNSALDRPELPRDLLPRSLEIQRLFAYSDSLDEDPLAATAHTPCWAINIAAAAGHAGFHIGDPALPCPGLVQRRLFRADLNPDERRQIGLEIILEALHEALCDIAVQPRTAAVLNREFPNPRSNSRLMQAWMTLCAFGGLTTAQLARALSTTKAGAAKQLSQLTTLQLITPTGKFLPHKPAIQIPIAFPQLHHD
ncbi:MAG: hypothetical protein WAT18_02825 [Sphingorhabdus sp.]